MDFYPVVVYLISYIFDIPFALNCFLQLNL